MANKSDKEINDGLEYVDKSKGSKDESAPTLVNKDNGTQTFEDSSMEKVTEPLVVEGAASMDNVEVATDQTRVDYIETAVVVREKRIINESLDAEKYQELLDTYKQNDPKKYAAKKDELEKKLAALKDKEAQAKKAKKEDK